MPTGISLHFAVSDPKNCCGGVRLAGETQDALALADLARSENFWVRDVLADDRVTKKAVLGALCGAAAELAKGDILLLTFSGHGCQVTDDGGWEAVPENGYDETWCLADGQIADDELFRVWANFAPGVRILIISDSCHSGTVAMLPVGGISKSADDVDRNRGGGEETVPAWADAAWNQAMRRSQQRRALEWGISSDNAEFILARRSAPVEVQASILLLSGCRERERAQVRGGRSVFVNTFTDLWKQTPFPKDGTYESLVAEVSKRVAWTNPQQHPGFAVFGPEGDAFLKQRPFTI